MSGMSGMSESSDGLAMKRVTYTLSETEQRMLVDLIRWWHATDPKAASQTVRRCIREAYEREKVAREREERGK